MAAQLSTDEILLVLLAHFGGSLQGKTLLQKRVYFLSRLLKRDLGFEPHYYGPYSSEVETALDKAKALGFIQEKALGFGVAGDNGFEVRRYDYRLTEDGKHIVEYLEKRYPDECADVRESLDRISNAGDTGDYMSLAVAAKTYHILSEEQTPVPYEKIRSKAEDLGWRIDSKSIDSAGEFLEKLGLAERRKIR